MRSKFLYTILVLMVLAFVMPKVAYGYSNRNCMGGADTDCDDILNINDNCPGVKNGSCVLASDDSSAAAEEDRQFHCDINGDDIVTDAEVMAGNQANWNASLDSVGDACDDSDIDGADGVMDWEDNCKLTNNPDQADDDPNELALYGEHDGIGNACDDDDKDGILDYEVTWDAGVMVVTVDNCLGRYNPMQQDYDDDGIGDACDPCRLDPDNICGDDVDLDGVLNWEDNCPVTPNPDQADDDFDDVGNRCDNCVSVFNPHEVADDGTLYQPDEDGDHIGDACEMIKAVPAPIEPGEEYQGNGGCNVGFGASPIAMLAMLLPLLAFRRKK